MAGSTPVSPPSSRSRLSRRSDSSAGAMRRLISAAVLGLALGGVGLGGLLLGLRWLRPAAAQSAVQTPAFVSPCRTEEEWLLGTITGDLSDMAAFALHPQSARPATKVTVRHGQAGATFVDLLATPGPALHQPLRIVHSIWSPEDYETLARRLTAGLPAARMSSRPDDDGLLRRLLDPRPAVIEGENQTLSAALRERPTDPALHEDAALLLAAFAMREAAGSGTDIRPILCRMTAHLAFALALRASDTPGPSGKYARAALSALAQRGAEAEAEIEQTRAASPPSAAQEAWRRILLMWVNEDWRLVGDLAKASFAERLGWLRAADATLGPAQAEALLRRAGVGPGPEADWAWILTRAPSVEVGNELLDYGVDATLRECDYVWSLVHGGALAQDRRIDVLNEPAPAFVTSDGPRVIAWGTWAAMYQREILHLLERSEHHYRHNLGLAEAAEEFAAEKAAQYSRLALFPELAACWEAEKKKPAPGPLEGAIALVLRRPDLVTSGYWDGLQIKAARQGLSRRMPPAATWFTTGCPRGTTFDVGVRVKVLPALFGPATVEALKATSPRSYQVALAQISGPGVSLAESEAAFGDRSEYDLRVLRRLSDRAYVENPERSLQISRRMCDMDANWCDRLGGDCVNRRDEAGAVAAFERMIDEASDRVLVSNNCAWLVKHYLRVGRRERARQIAQIAAEAGSADGILTMAMFLEETGRYAEAEQNLRRQRERYPDEDPDFPLIAFHHRMLHIRRASSYERAFALETRDLFPKGLERVTLASFTSPPTDGAVFTEETPALRRNGMQKGDVVVALDGWRVHTLRQYYAVRAFDDDPDLRLIVWRAGRYSEVPARRLYRSFGVDMADYPPPRR